MREKSQIALLLFVNLIGAESDESVVCQLIDLIFDEKLTVVHHFIDDFTPTFEYAQCVENHLGSTPAFYSFQVSF